MKYWLIIILFVPFCLYGIVRAVTLYKLKRISPNKAALKIILWSGFMLICIFAKLIVDEAIKLNVTGGDYITIYDIALAFSVILSFMMNIKLIIMLNNTNSKLIKLVSRYSNDASKISSSRKTS